PQPVPPPGVPVSGRVQHSDGTNVGRAALTLIAEALEASGHGRGVASASARAPSARPDGAVPAVSGPR
ncbi:hypothetical protein, partial [Streptomyces halstedii]|uniref:hypothetical protein n=1 Tax=Streptomyces halstedii TaxID=1944 RepID=UPI0033BDF384